MPPKKGVKTPQVPAPPKTYRTRSRKSALNNSSTEKNNVQNVPSSPASKNVTKTRKSNIDENKIMLANEVVKRQLQKKQGICDKANEVIAKINNEPVVKKNIVLKINRLPTSNTVLDDVPEKSLPVKKKTKAVIKKNIGDSPKEKGIKLESEKKMPKKGINAKKTAKTPLSAKSTRKSTEKKDLTSPKSGTKHKICLNQRTSKKQGPKSRIQTTNEIMNTEEKIKRSEESKVKSSNSSIYKDALKARRLSVTSSELSWTKDISSSTSTCITVSSKDFFSIDNKVPVLKLTNIDREMKNHCNVQEINNISKTDPNIDKTIVVCKINDFGDTSKVDKTGIVNNDNIENNDGTKNIHRKMIYNNKFNDTINKGNDNEQNIVNNVDTTEQDVQSLENIRPPALSSSDTSSFEEVSENNENNKDLSTSMNQTLNSLLRNFDHEIVNWVGYADENSNVDTSVQNKMLNRNIFRQERDIQLCCNNITKIIHSSESDNLYGDESEEEDYDTQTSKSDEGRISTNTDVKMKRMDSSPDKKIRLSEELTSKSFNQSSNYDQDDALSLYADSITEIESLKNYRHTSRRQTSDEYVPAPVKNLFKKPEPVSYKPSKIDKALIVDSENVNKQCETAVCEKSNADSTSTCREIKDNSSEEHLQFYEDRLGDLHNVVEQKHSNSKPQDIERPIGILENGSYLAEQSSKRMLRVRSSVFNGACFFNLVYACRRINCTFPHKRFAKNVIESRLMGINDQKFQEEYTLLRNSSKVRRFYGMCFIQDCIRRKLTRFLIEIAIDFVTKLDCQSSQDLSLTVEAVEAVLLYLNDVDLTGCMDLLWYKTKPNQMLCDIFMDVIGKSQNFSRFKSVFINLTDLVVSIGREFDSEVVINILERVCILPYEDNLSRALLKVIKNTDRNILTNSMVDSFEQRLRYGNKILYEEFSKFKEENSRRVGNPRDPYGSTSSLDTENMTSKSGYSDSNMRYSPDTTNLDVNKMAAESQITRTISVQKFKYFDKSALSTSSESDGAMRSERRFVNWKNNYRRQSNFTNPGARELQLGKRRSQQHFHSGIPNKFPRLNGRPSF